MRPDFAHVFDEPARRGSSAMEECCRKGRAPRDPDDMPRFEGIADCRRRRWNRKERSSAWNTLERWLRSQAGRPWNDVWSEICQVSSLHSGSTRNLRDAVERRVDLHTCLDEDGTLRVNGRGYEPCGSYVDPDGILRHAERRPRHRRKRTVNEDARDCGPSRGLRRIDGLWYEVFYATRWRDEVKVEDAGGAVKVVFSDDYVLVGTGKLSVDTTVLRGEWWSRNAAGNTAWRKRALSREELRASGLANDPSVKEPQRLKIFRRGRDRRRFRGVSAVSSRS